MALVSPDSKFRYTFGDVFNLRIKDGLNGRVLTQNDIREARKLWDEQHRWSIPVDNLNDLMGTSTEANYQRLKEIRIFMARPWRGQECSLDDICMYSARRDVDPEPMMRMAYWMGEFRNPLMQFINKD